MPRGLPGACQSEGQPRVQYRWVMEIWKATNDMAPGSELVVATASCVAWPVLRAKNTNQWMEPGWIYPMARSSDEHQPPALSSTPPGPTDAAQSVSDVSPGARRRCRGSRRLAALGRGVRMFACLSNQRHRAGRLKKARLERLGTWLIGAIFDEKHLTAISRTTRVHFTTTEPRATGESCSLYP